jgi:hypothetical protein
MRFPRMTIRRWTVIVVVLAVPLVGCIGRWTRFAFLAAQYDRYARNTAAGLDFDGSQGPPTPYRAEEAQWYLALAEHCERAAARPWLPVLDEPSKPAAMSGRYRPRPAPAVVAMVAVSLGNLAPFIPE